MNRTRLLWAVEISSPFIILFAWWWATTGLLPRVAPNYMIFFPDPFRIFNQFARDFLTLQGSSIYGPTLVRFLIAYFTTAAVGIGLGLFLGTHRMWLIAFGPVLTFFRALPGVALLPIIALFLGYGDAAKIVFMITVAVWPILLNTIDGVRGIDPVLLESAKAYRITGRDRLFHVILPAALPQMFAGLRIALAVVLIVSVLGELIGSNSGIGYYLTDAQGRFDLPRVWAGIILIGIIGYSMNICFALVEKRLLAWHRGAKASALA